MTGEMDEYFTNKMTGKSLDCATPPDTVTLSREVVDKIIATLEHAEKTLYRHSAASWRIDVNHPMAERRLKETFGHERALVQIALDKLRAEMGE